MINSSNNNNNGNIIIKIRTRAEDMRKMIVRVIRNNIIINRINKIINISNMNLKIKITSIKIS